MSLKDENYTAETPIWGEAVLRNGETDASKHLAWPLKLARERLSGKIDAVFSILLLLLPHHVPVLSLIVFFLSLISGLFCFTVL